jgi:hypothetical protein
VVTVLFRVALASSYLAAAFSGAGLTEPRGAQHPPQSTESWTQAQWPKLPAYLTAGEAGASASKMPPSPSPLFRLEHSYFDGRMMKVQQAPPWAIAGGAPSTDGLILPPDPDGLSGWILKATPQELAASFLVAGVSIVLLACSAVRSWRRARRGELTAPKRLWQLLVRLNYRRAVLFLWLVLIAGTTLWAPFKLLDGRGHVLGPAPRQLLLFARNETDYMGRDTNIVALDFQRLFAEWVAISAVGGALLALVRPRR